MRGARWLHATWCDDVRQEVGNKSSFMGVYNGVLLVPILPTVVKRLSVVIEVVSPIEKPFKKLTVRVMQSDRADPIGFSEIPAPQLVASPPVLGSPVERMESVAQCMTMVFSFGELQFSDKTEWLKVFADTEDGLLESFKLSVEVPRLPAVADGQNLAKGGQSAG
jgi:hypothetical protein